MTQLAGKTVMAVDELSVDHDAGAHAGSERYHDEVLHTASCAVGHFAQGGGVGVVGDSHRYSGKGLAHHLGHRYGSPRKVRRTLYFAGIVIGVRGTYPYALDLIFGIVGFKQAGNLAAQILDVIFEF